MKLFNENQIPVKEMQAVGLHDGKQWKISDDIKDQLLKGQVTDFVTLEGIQVNDEKINIDTKLSLQETENGAGLFFHPIYAREQKHELLSEEEQQNYKSGIHIKPITASGRIVEYGEAPYEFDERNKQSFFIKLEKANGEVKNIWGADLKNALDLSGHREGDEIAISHMGTEDVKTEVFKRDANDRIIGKEWIDVRRNNWKIETFDPQKHVGKSVLFEYDKDTKSYVGMDSEKINAPEEVNGIQLSEDQKKKYKEGHEVVLEDDTKIQASPAKGMRFNTPILIVSTILDGGMTYFLLKAAHRLSQNKKENKRIYERAYKNALIKVQAHMEIKQKAAPNNKQIANDLNIIKKEINLAGISMSKPKTEKSINSMKEKVNDSDLLRNAVEQKEALENERNPELKNEEQQSTGRRR